MRICLVLLHTVTPSIAFCFLRLLCVFPTDGGNIEGNQGYESCLVKPGWGLDDGLLAEPCYLGEWSAGLHRLPCTKCPAAYTTLQEESVSEADCVVQPGW